MTLPNGWVGTTIAEIAQLRTGPFGSTVHKSDYVVGGTPLINPMHIVDGKIRPSTGVTVSRTKAEQLAEFQLKLGDVLIGRRGEMGRCAVVQSSEAGYLIGTGSMAITPSEAVACEYLCRLLASPDVVAQLEGESVGSTMVNLNQGILQRLPVSLPPLAEQRRIIAKLDTLTARLTRARTELDRVAAMAKEMRAKVLASAFSGTLTASSRTSTAVSPHPQIDDQERGLWPGTDIPIDWSWVAFDEFFNDLTDSRRKLAQKEYLPEGRFPVVDQGIAYVGGYSDDDSLVHLADPPVIIFGDHTRCVKLVTTNFIQGADGVKVLAPVPGVLPSYARYALEAVEIPAKGYSRHMKFVRKTLWPLPPTDEQSDIVEKIDNAFARADRLEAEAARARTLLDRIEAALLARAFRGELVPQDPTDEPASVLLDRIRAERADAPKAKRGRRAKELA